MVSEETIVDAIDSAPVEHLLSKFLPAHLFEPIITRAFRPPKPDPAGILHIATSWATLDNWTMPPYVSPPAPSDQAHVQPGMELDVIMVGDSIDDMTAGYRAGAATVLLANPENQHLAGHEHTDLVIDRLSDLIGVLEKGFVGKTR